MDESSHPASHVREARAGASALGSAAATPKGDAKKTRQELLDEIAVLRSRIGKLESFETDHKSIETELKGTRQRLQYLISPAPSSATMSSRSSAARPRR